MWRISSLLYLLTDVASCSNFCNPEGKCVFPNFMVYRGWLAAIVSTQLAALRNTKARVNVNTSQAFYKHVFTEWVLLEWSHNKHVNVSSSLLCDLYASYNNIFVLETFLTLSHCIFYICFLFSHAPQYQLIGLTTTMDIFECWCIILQSIAAIHEAEFYIARKRKK